MTPTRCISALDGARVFVQLAKRSSATATKAPVLDILTPRWSAPGSMRAISGRSSYSTKPMTGRGVLRGCTALNAQAPASRIHTRQFGSTASRRATVCVHNPQKDDDGNPMNMEITERASKRLAQIMKKENNPNLALRVQVESGGCHGFQYVMSLVTLPPLGAPQADWDAAVSEDDTIFNYVEDAEASSSPENTHGKPRIVVDESSLELLKGAKVDFVMELIGSEFKIMDIPGATSACGCGTSFDIKI